MRYISAQQAAAKWGISKRRVQVLCTENRIKDATRIGNMWVVPENAQKPADGRVQTHPVLESPTARVARAALKKLTADAYQAINSELNNPSLSKMVYISLLATTIFCDIQNAEATDDQDRTYMIVSAELLCEKPKGVGITTHYHAFSDLIQDFERFICRYSEYVDDILSWAYQYVNKLSLDSGLETTQFFTEKYMIEYLTRGLSEYSAVDGAYLDPACGGGNFLSHLLTKQFNLNCRVSDEPIRCIQDILDVLYGYELDPNLAAVASVNLKLKALMLLSKVQRVTVDDWRWFCPNIYYSVQSNGFGFLEADFAAHKIRRVSDGKLDTLLGLVNHVTAIYTNPPFQTVKGMAIALKNHLKKNFPDSKCDLCNAFILQCLDKIRAGGIVGLVTQSSWMYLDSFEDLRRRVVISNTIESLADLGSGAFYDLSGEKANVALVRMVKERNAGSIVRVLALRDVALKEKTVALAKASDSEMLIDQTDLFSGEHLAFSLNQPSQKEVVSIAGKYGDYGVPMQGTSTGNAAKLIGHYWEHLGDPDWVPVSKGGSYSRWCGLNNYVLKWGADGEYIRATKGSALRNTKYFDRTALVYSDTGTSGFNARLLEKGQLFVASGPGIRDITGNAYAHLALLNSRVFSYYLRALSPKLTVAAGYIARVPVPAGLLERAEMEELGKACFSMKKEHLKMRPNNLEWCAPSIESVSIDAYVSEMLVKEFQSELAKLTCEKKLDDIILEAYALDKLERGKLDDAVGVPVLTVKGAPNAVKLDKAIAQALDTNCQLMRTRANKRSLGCDGILEFIARKEQVSPIAIASLIRDNTEMFAACKAKYTNLVLHNIVLAILGFRLERSDGIQVSELRSRFVKRYPSLKDEWDRVENWIIEQFNSVHEQAFCAIPYYRYENGEFLIMI